MASSTRNGCVLARRGDGREAGARRLHVAFSAPSRALVDRFWIFGTEADFRDDGAPGPRLEHGDDYYGGFLLDPDGNSVEAVHHRRALTKGGGIDHRWIRAPNLDASREFFELIAPYSGFELRDTRPDRAHFAGDDASFALVRGEATENLPFAFSADANETVDEFHRAPN